VLDRWGGIGLVEMCYIGLGCVVLSYMLFVMLCYERLGMLTREKIKWQEYYHGYHGNDLDNLDRYYVCLS
jgi:hypothetical protein